MQTLKVTNLPRWISEIHLKQFFNNCGNIAHAAVPLDARTLRPLGYGFIRFATAEAMENALEKNGALLDGSMISVEVASESEEVIT